MEEYKQIGLNIWGIRGGFRRFCHSDNLDIETPEIANTWGDIRDFVYVSDLNVRYYALEFTSTYKVFTIYRPENDTSRTGAYVATTLYVPHALKINNILDLLKQISDAYHKDHYDAFGNPNNAPDYIQVYMEFIKGFAANIVREDVVRPWEPSRQDNTPRVLPFDNIEVVAKFFATPYRTIFKEHQEVMFWDINHIQNEVFGVKFLKPGALSDAFKLNGEGIPGQFEGGHILNDPPAGLAIASFRREGADITQTWRSASFYDNTNIEIELKKPYHKPLKYTGTMAGFSGNPFVKQGNDYRFNSTAICQPNEYEAVLLAPSADNLPFELIVGGKKTVPMSGGRGTFRFDGTEVSGSCDISLKLGDGRFKIGDINMANFFSGGSDVTNALKSCTIEGLKAFRFRFNKECSGQFCLAYKPSAPFKTTGCEYAVVLPAATKMAEISFKVDGYDADLKGETETTATVTLKRNAFSAEVVVPDDLKRFMAGSYFALKAEGNRFLTTAGSFVFENLPNRIKGGLQSLAKLGMSVNGAQTVPCKHDVETNGDIVRLRPALMIINNEASVKAEVVIADTVIAVASGTQCVVPQQTGTGWLRNAAAFQAMPPQAMSGYQLLTLKNKPSTAPVTNGGQAGATTAQQSGNSNQQTLGYQGGKISGTNPDLQQSNSGNKTGKDDKDGGGGKDGKGSKRWWPFLGLGLAALLLVGGGILGWRLGWFGGGGEKPQFVVKVQMEHGTKINSVKPESDTIKAEVLSKQDSIFYVGISQNMPESFVLIISTEGEGESNENVSTKNKDMGDTIPLLCKSQAYKDLQDVKIEDSVCNSISSYAKLAHEYESSSFRKKCVEKATDLIKETPTPDTIPMKLFNGDYTEDSFSGIDEANDIRAYYDSILQQIRGQNQQAANAQKKLEEFIEQFKKVRSLKCTFNEIKKLKRLYKDLQVEEVDLLNALKGAIGPGAKISKASWVDVFITNQQKVLGVIKECFGDGSFDTVEYNLALYISRNNNVYNYGDSFSEKQLQAMEKLIENETTFSGIKKSEKIQQSRDDTTKYYEIINDWKQKE